MDQFSAHLDRGWDLVSRGDLAGALVSARKGLELDADSPEAHNLLGFVLAAEGHAEEALEHYRRAIDLDETFVEAMLNAAEVLVHPLGQVADAIAILDEALDYVEGQDETADALLLKVDALLQGGDKEAARSVVARLPSGPFENPHLPFAIGRARFETGDADGAEPLLAQAVQEEPEHADAHYYLGLLHELRGDVRSATLAFLLAREIEAHAPAPPWAVPTDQFERRVESAIRRLPEGLREVLDGSLVVVVELPGAEVVAEGVDPHVPVLLDGLGGDAGRPKLERLFVYQRNVERISMNAFELEDEVVRCIEYELSAALPEIAASIRQRLEGATAEDGAKSSPLPAIDREVTSNED